MITQNQHVPTPEFLLSQTGNGDYFVLNVTELGC